MEEIERERRWFNNGRKYHEWLCDHTDLVVQNSRPILGGREHATIGYELDCGCHNIVHSKFVFQRLLETCHKVSFTEENDEKNIEDMLWKEISSDFINAGENLYKKIASANSVSKVERKDLTKLTINLATECGKYHIYTEGGENIPFKVKYV